MNDNHQTYMVNIRDIVHSAVYAADAVEAVQKALAEKYGIPISQVHAMPADTYSASANSRWQFTVAGGGIHAITPSRVARRPKTATALAEFIGASQLPFAEV